MEEIRLDKLLVDRGLVSTRTRAESIIAETGVLVDGKLVTKPGKKFPETAEIQLVAEEIPWVSRGALKLVAALEHWPIQLDGKIALDLGASTGGFTEVLLSKGVSKVFCVDVGKGQLHPRIAVDERIVNLEKTHVRELTHALIDTEIDILVVDVSFISLTKVIPFVHPFLKNGADVILLIKPQFEVGKTNLNKHGIVKSPALYPEIIESITLCGRTNNLDFVEYIPSPILGGDGNREFLAYFKKVQIHE
ncbi:MAG: hypothetical protein RL264_71 [Bacteroidota bacterium]|jgi:23S rRNA (cytidine1920-2'-O)/16S rRNA (cytidine1409-2'-O)-methyltransferase